MKRFVVSSSVVFVALLVCGVVVRPADAVTTLTLNAIAFDPISVGPDQTLYVHTYNAFASGTVTYRGMARTTNGSVRYPFGGGGLTAGYGADDFVLYSQLQGNGSNIAVAVTVYFGVPPITALPPDWPARIAGSVEVIDNTTHRATEIVTHRHVMLATGPCVSCP